MHEHIPYSNLFHAVSKNKYTGDITPQQPYPQEWLDVYYKTYPRFEQIKLPQPHTIDVALSSVYQNRCSKREFGREPLPLEELATVLGYGCGLTSSEETPFRRTYPSGGGRYPIETYVYVQKVEGLPTGVYHYALKEHALTALPGNSTMSCPEDLLFDTTFINAHAVIFLTACFRRTQQKYRERGYRFALIEAGHIGQNIQLVSAARNLASCPVGAVYDEHIETYLNIDGVEESLVYTHALGS